jgi:ABC-type branched-subunit amino acid transport system substrate-binding protein
MAEAMTDEFINNCIAAAAGFALLFVGVPDVQMMEALYQVRANVQAELAETFGPDVAAAVAQAFVAAVVGRRREMDAAGAMPRILN